MRSYSKDDEKYAKAYDCEGDDHNDEEANGEKMLRRRGGKISIFVLHNFFADKNGKMNFDNDDEVFHVDGSEMYWFFKKVLRKNCKPPMHYGLKQP